MFPQLWTDFPSPSSPVQRFCVTLSKDKPLAVCLDGQWAVTQRHGDEGILKPNNPQSTFTLYSLSQNDHNTHPYMDTLHTQFQIYLELTVPEPFEASGVNCELYSFSAFSALSLRSCLLVSLLSTNPFPPYKIVLLFSPLRLSPC